MKNKILLLTLLLSFNYASGRRKSDTYSKWYYKPAAGINIPISKLLSGEITDHLFEYSDNSYCWQVFSGNFFLSQKWGVEFSYQANASTRISDRSDRFNSEIQKKFSDDYFISSSEIYNNSNIISGNFERAYLGVVYRIEKPKFIVLPKLLIGVTSFYTDWWQADLKEKGTNTILKLSYNLEKRPNDHFTVAPALTFGYRLSRRFIANFDLLYAYYKTNIEIIEKTSNSFSGETSYKTFDYKRNMQTLTMGIGMIIELKPVPKIAMPNKDLGI